MKIIYIIAIAAVFAIQVTLLSGCERNGEAKGESATEATLENMKASAGRLVDNTRSALDSAVETAKGIGEQSEEALKVAGDTIAERSDETISAARDMIVELSDEGDDIAQDLTRKAKEVYRSAEERTGELIEKAANDMGEPQE